MIWPGASFKKLGLLEFQNKGVPCDLMNPIVQGLAWTRVQLEIDPKISEMHMVLICKLKKSCRWLSAASWDYNICSTRLNWKEVGNTSIFALHMILFVIDIQMN